MGAVVLLASSCATEPGRLTGLGGAAGGALGAGLGALVGSQTGDPTTGLLMGGAAGSVAGAAAGNVFEAEEAELEEKRTVVQQRDREISQRREQIAALRSKSASSDFGRYDNDSSNDYSDAPRRPLRGAVSRDSMPRPAPERREPAPSILPLDMEDVRPIYVERRPGGRPRSEPTSEQRLEQIQPEKIARDESAEPKVQPRRASSSLKEDVRENKTDVRENKTVRVENAVDRETRRETVASVQTAPVRVSSVRNPSGQSSATQTSSVRTSSVRTSSVAASPVQASSVKIVAPVRKATGVTKEVPRESRQEERAIRPVSPSFKQVTAKLGEREKETKQARVVEPAVKPDRRESRVVTEERQPETVRVARKSEQIGTPSRISAPAAPLSSKPALPVRQAPGLLSKENATQAKESRTQSKPSTMLAVQATREGRERPVSKPQPLEARVRLEPQGREKEIARKTASHEAASSLKKELVALAKQPVPAQDKPVVVARKEPEASVSAALQAPDEPKRASGECGQASQEIEKSKQVSEPAEKLFHYRRALRLCPSESRYHVHLGDHYRALKRDADANFEYKEALALDPSNTEVKQKVEELKNG